MSVIKGYDGHLDFGVIIDSDMAYTTHAWSLDVSADMQDITDFSSTGWRDFLSTLKSWTGSMELYVDGTKQIQPSDMGAQTGIRFYLNSTDYLWGSALVSGWSPATSVDGVATQTLTIQGRSDLFFTSS